MGNPEIVIFSAQVQIIKTAVTFTGTLFEFKTVQCTWNDEKL